MMLPHKKTPRLSLEFTSPSNPVAEKTIFKSASILKHYKLSFVCVNFGGDIIAPNRAMEINQRLGTQHHLHTIGYLRRSNITKQDFNAISASYAEQNIKKLFITEGRRLSNAPLSIDHYASLINAVKHLKRHHNVEIAIEARPEHHNSEVDMIKSLIDLGVDEIITRFSFTSSTTVKFLEKIRQTHELPKIRIGILPVENPSKTFLTAHRLNVSVPSDLQRIFGQYEDNDTINANLGMHILLEQTRTYMAQGFNHFHIRFGRSHTPIEALARYYNIAYTPPCHTLQKLQSLRQRSAASITS